MKWNACMDHWGWVVLLRSAKLMISERMGYTSMTSQCLMMVLRWQSFFTTTYRDWEVREMSVRGTIMDFILLLCLSCLTKYSISQLTFLTTCWVASLQGEGRLLVVNLMGSCWKISSKQSSKVWPWKALDRLVELLDWLIPIVYNYQSESLQYNMFSKQEVKLMLIQYIIQYPSSSNSIKYLQCVLTEVLSVTDLLHRIRQSIQSIFNIILLLLAISIRILIYSGALQTINTKRLPQVHLLRLPISETDSRLRNTLPSYILTLAYSSVVWGRLRLIGDEDLWRDRHIRITGSFWMINAINN